MSASTGKTNSSGLGYFEPSLGLAFMPRCAGCGERHPQAHKPPVLSDVCLKCGAPVAVAGARQTVPAVLTGLSPWVVLARICFGMSRWLQSLRRKS